MKHTLDGMMTSKQNTDHVFMIEPTTFYAHPETMETNFYQSEDATSAEEILAEAVREFRQYRDALVKAGVAVTTMIGSDDCPDHIYCDWLTTFPGRQMILSPMATNIRRMERKEWMVDVFKRSYDMLHDYRDKEKEGLYLEANASMVLDRVNKIAFAALSKRTVKEMAQQWADDMGYELVLFRTELPGQDLPVYHTDLVIWIGTELAACCYECIVEEDREAVKHALEKTGRQVVSLSMAEHYGYAGNSLQLFSMTGRKLLTMSSRAFASLSDENRKILTEHYDEIVHTPITTIERYGGGSARCMLAELF